MTAVNDILQQLPLGQLASVLGTDEATLEKAAVPAVTSLLGGLTQNAQTEEGAHSLAAALSDHAATPLLSTDSAVDVTSAASEGEKILGHVFGNQTEGVAQALGAQAGVSSSLVQKLLPILAPIVLSYLGKQLSGQGGVGNVLGQILSQGAGQSNGTATTGSNNILGGVLSNVLGQVLGAGSSGNPFDPAQAQDTATPTAAQGGDIVSQILGGLLGNKN